MDIRTSNSSARRTELYGDPRGLQVHSLILEGCRRFGERTAIVDQSCDPPRRLSFSDYGELVERLGAALSTRCRPGEVIAIFLCNSWEFCATYHAATLAGCIPTLLNPTYREREVRYQLENSGAVVLITDAAQIKDINLSGLSRLRQVFVTRNVAAGAEDFRTLLEPSSQRAESPAGDTQGV